MSRISPYTHLLSRSMQALTRDDLNLGGLSAEHFDANRWIGLERLRLVHGNLPVTLIVSLSCAFILARHAGRGDFTIPFGPMGSRGRHDFLVAVSLPARAQQIVSQRRFSKRSTGLSCRGKVACRSQLVQASVSLIQTPVITTPLRCYAPLMSHATPRKLAVVVGSRSAAQD